MSHVATVRALTMLLAACAYPSDCPTGEDQFTPAAAPIEGDRDDWFTAECEGGGTYTQGEHLIVLCESYWCAGEHGADYCVLYDSFEAWRAEHCPDCHRLGVSPYGYQEFGAYVLECCDEECQAARASGDWNVCGLQACY